MTLLNKGPSNSDFADGPLLRVECLLRACVRISYMRARARFLVLLNCHLNYLFLSFFRVGRAFFKVFKLYNLFIFATSLTTLKPLLQMLPFEFYQLVAYPLELSRRVRYKNYETFPAAVSGVSHFLSSSCKVFVYRCIVPFEGNISRRLITSYEPE